MRSGNGSDSFLATMRLNKIARDEASTVDNRESHRPLVKASKSPLDLPIFRMITFMIVLAISFSLVIPGGLFNHQVALADTGNAGVDNGSTSYTPVRAPLNPAFVTYMNSKSGLQSMSLSASSPILGLIPAPLDLSGLTGEQIDTSGSFSAYNLPGSFDLRTQNPLRLTPVKDQGDSGSCWAFATYGSMESFLLPNETWDFSENNLKNNAGFDVDPNGGGNYEMAMAYLTRWSGPVDESDDPYDAASTTSPTNLNVQKQVQNAYVIPDRINFSDNDNIKLALTKYGAIFTSMYWSNNYYNGAHYAYYDNTKESSKGINNNHAVTIVGWDDNYSGSNFYPTANDKGAFIVKNSWGTSWGDSGYFYVSYDDMNFGVNNVIFTADPVMSYDHVYQYDPLGWVGNMGIGSNTTWFANDFTAGSKEKITAVGFYTNSLDSQFTVDILENGVIVETTTGTLPMAGYHTVVLNSTVQVSDGNKFRVAVELPTHGNSYPIPIEYPQPGYSSKATSNASESFVGTSLSEMKDVREYYTNANVCLKAYTIDVDHGSGTLQFDQSSYNVSEGDAYATVNVTLSAPPAEPIRVCYTTTNGIALSGINYKRTSGVLQFASGKTVASFNVPIIDNYVINGNRSFNVSLSNPTGGTSLGSPSIATVNIIYDDIAGFVYVEFNERLELDINTSCPAG